MRVWIWICVMGVAGIAMAADAPDVSKPAAKTPKVKPATPPAEAASAWGTTMAKVNGKAIPMSRLHEALVQDYGLALAQQLIADELVRQECERKNVPYPVSAKEVAIATGRAIDRNFQYNTTMTTADKQKLLRQYLIKNRLTRRQWDATMARYIRLRRLAGSEVTVSEAELTDAYRRQFDGKKRVRHIQVPTLQVAQEVLKQIKSGSKFTELAATYSTNPTGKSGGWLPDIGMRSAPTGVAQAVVNAARALDAPGEVSAPIQAGTNFHILKLEEIVEPRNVKLDDVRNKLTLMIREQKMFAAQLQIMRYLVTQAQKRGDIRYVDPSLRSQSRKQQEKAAER